MNYPMTLSSHIEGIYQFLKRDCKNEGDRLFSRICGDRTRENVLKLREARLRLDVRKSSFLMRVVRHWNGLPSVVVDASFLETFKVRLDEV